MKPNWLKVRVELGTKKTNPEGLVFECQGMILLSLSHAC